MAHQRVSLIAGIYIVLVIQFCSGIADEIRIKRSPCDQTTCPTGSRCVNDATSSGYHCQCYSGYIPPTCVDRNECSLAKTLCHNGTCFNTPGSFRCLCNDGFAGSRCTDDVDECQSNPCLNNNTCVNTPGSYHCRCYSGYIPPDCRDRDECAIVKDLCSNGTCVNTHGSYRCNCHYGYRGSHCRQRDPCAMSPCQNGGTCTSGLNDNSYSCRCYAGFNSSSNCDDIDECRLSSKICLHGNCMNTPGSFKCACANGYSGMHCQNQIDFCESAPCLNGGTCIRQQNGFKCNCFEGFNNSANCIDIDECKLDPHFCGNGSCINTLGSFKCNCIHGYQGQRCTDDTDECQLQPCVHGSCVNTVGSYSCTCFDGYSGKTCSDLAVNTLSTTRSSRPTKMLATTSLNSPKASTLRQHTGTDNPGRHSKITDNNLPTSTSTVSHQSGIPALGRYTSEKQNKSWMSGHYWVVIIIAVAVIGVGVGGAVWEVKRRRRHITYKTFGNESTPSSPSSPSSTYQDNPLYAQIHTVNGGSSNTSNGSSIENPVYHVGDLPSKDSISIIAKTNTNVIHLNRDAISMSETDFGSNAENNSVVNPIYDKYSGYDAGASET